MTSAPRYWFAAKRYGWGWGAPRTWEGGLILTGYVALVLAPAVLLDGDRRGVATLAAVVVATPTLVWVCWRKGEPPGRS